MKMAILVALMLQAALIPLGSASPPTVPAFFWSPHFVEIYDGDMITYVDYQTISSRDLAKAVLFQGGWSDLLCSAKKFVQHGDLAVVFVGRELQSMDISSNSHAGSGAVNSLKDAYTKSNFSLAFPYVAASSNETMEDVLLSVFKESCSSDLEDVTKVALLGPCSVQADDPERIANLQSLHDYLVSRREKRIQGNADLIIYCLGKSAVSHELDIPDTEGEIFSELTSSLEQLEEKYSVLYVSDPSRSVRYPSMRELDRFLAESSTGNSSANGTCDGVCQIKSSLWEGLIVGIVLLIILLCGLCCMAGIQTPTRFEVPQES
ncbi:hypothetical protein SAY86_032261 [Trapa natans]|uniref:V-type proton ATPase subunit S1/VOA1 transmembrane domain-containing protein n=1 Tax=Trapa natans TaxID=22666 RepID=A0AAN7LN51_TRANT|nr:hypothetical protein SAY86_032261 [Trapa natans]